MAETGGDAAGTRTNSLMLTVAIMVTIIMIGIGIRMVIIRVNAEGNVLSIPQYELTEPEGAHGKLLTDESEKYVYSVMEYILKHDIHKSVALKKEVTNDLVAKIARISRQDYPNGPILYHVKRAGDYIKSIRPVYVDEVTESDFHNKIEELRNKIGQEGSLKRIYEVVCESLYKSDTTTDLSYLVYSVIDGNARCDGYSMLFSYLLNLYGYENYIRTSSEINHSWNLVKTDEGWREFDVCWGDTDNENVCSYECFMRTKAEMEAIHKCTKDNYFDYSFAT